jgi:hypothetical protein
MAAPSPTEINRANFRFRKQRNERLDYLLDPRAHAWRLSLNCIPQTGEFIPS